MPSYANTLYTLEAANLFCGKAPLDGSVSLHLKLTTVKLPAITEQTQPFAAAGSVGVLAFPAMLIAPMECAFVIVGIDPEIYELPLSWAADHQWFFFYGVIRDRAGRDAFKASAVMRGRLAHVELSPYERGGVAHTACKINSITYYQLDVGTRPIYLWDHFNSVFFIGGKDRWKDARAALNLPGTSFITTVPGVGP